MLAALLSAPSAGAQSEPVAGRQWQQGVAALQDLTNSASMSQRGITARPTFGRRPLRMPSLFSMENYLEGVTVPYYGGPVLSHVKVYGTLFHRFTGHHHARVLLSVADMRPLPK